MSVGALHGEKTAMTYPGLGATLAGGAPRWSSTLLCLRSAAGVTIPTYARDKKGTIPTQWLRF